MTKSLVMVKFRVHTYGEKETPWKRRISQKKSLLKKLVVSKHIDQKFNGRKKYCRKEGNN